MMFGNWKIKITQCTQCIFATQFTYDGEFKAKAKQIKNRKSFNPPPLPPPPPQVKSC